MNRLCLMKNPELFQGETQIRKKSEYFEGWYFKFTNGKDTISFIPGINVNSYEIKAFIQVITNTKSYCINYDIKKFSFSYFPFYIKIDNNFFSKDKVKIDIQDIYQNIKILGNIEIMEFQNLNTNTFFPNIMGPFSYIPNMECNHAILSMKSVLNGNINIDDKSISFENGIGYIEKDWGYSFPKSYIWCQGNNFKNPNASFMISIADIPFHFFDFRGMICVLIVDGKEYKFTTYNGSKLINYQISDNKIKITLQNNSYFLNIESFYNAGNKLFAPLNGAMKREIFESINETIRVELRKNKKVVFQDVSKNCGLEIAQ